MGVRECSVGVLSLSATFLGQQGDQNVPHQESEGFPDLLHLPFSFFPCFPLVNNQPQLSIVLHYSTRLDGVNWRESVFLNQSCLNWINSLILHNSSGYAFSSLLSIFLYAMMEMEYLGSAEFSNYGTNWFHTGGTTSGATTPTVWKIS